VVALGAAARVVAAPVVGQAAARLTGRHTGLPQQVFTPHTEPDGQLMSDAHGVSESQAVEPGTHRPGPPVASATHTQSGFELLQGVNVAQLAPVHSVWPGTQEPLTQMSPAGQSESLVHPAGPDTARAAGTPKA
jgi:hypothetical protein